MKTAKVIRATSIVLTVALVSAYLIHCLGRPPAQIVGSLSAPEAASIRAAAERRVFLDYIGPWSVGNMTRIPAALNYRRAHPIVTLEVRSPSTVHALFSKPGVGDTLGYFHNVLGYEVVRTAGHWKVGAIGP